MNSVAPLIAWLLVLASLGVAGYFARQQVQTLRGLRRRENLALEDYRYLHSTRGELLRRLGRTAEARQAYRRALALVPDDAERRLLERRLGELGAATRPARR